MVRGKLVCDWCMRMHRGEFPFPVSQFPTLGFGPKRTRLHSGKAIIDIEYVRDDFERRAPRRDGEAVPSIRSFTEKVADIARRCGVPRKRKGIALDNDDPLLLRHRDLCRQRRLTGVPQDRAKLSLEIFKTRRAIRAKRMSIQAIDAAKFGRAPHRAKPQTKVFCLRDPESESQIYEDEDDIRRHVEDFFFKLFNFTGDHICPLPTWIFDFQTNDDLDDLLFFDGKTLFNLLQEMPLGKTGTQDMMVAEILRALDIDILNHLADIFRLRILNHCTDDLDTSWDFCIANLIPKVLRPDKISLFRPIAILPVISKLFTKLLLHLAKPHMRELRAPQYAFVPNHQAHEVVYMLRHLIEVAIK